MDILLRLGSNMQTKSFTRKKLILLLAHHKYTQSPEDGAKHFLTLSGVIVSPHKVSPPIPHPSLQPAAINISSLDYLPLFSLPTSH